jgi:hypothetical protein
MGPHSQIIPSLVSKMAQPFLPNVTNFPPSRPAFCASVSMDVVVDSHFQISFEDKKQSPFGPRDAAEK